MTPNIVYRHSEPSKIDQAAYGTICKVKHSLDDKSLIYVQISHCEEEPNWNYVGSYKIDITDEIIIQEVEGILKP